MRQTILARSVHRVLGGGEPTSAAIVMWRRSSRFPVSVATAAAVGWIVAVIVRVEPGAGRFMVAASVAVVAGAFTTERRILARVGSRLFLLTASPVRAVATGLDRELAIPVELVRRGATPVSADWSVAGEVWTVGRRSDADLSSLAAVLIDSEGHSTDR